ncbi:LOW QUALITY PROTEIN: Halomucin [Frankliniella fusca]|uniref:Halomucin n=1 Tax=Frankliniella fusca TaxID=407009 RepID=A0AAE1GVL6_9NEOP|nr:LOW QUALITY PROTEIN: Halomucin [Frankliniella fusca]
MEDDSGSANSSSDEEQERPAKQPRKEWLKHGQVPRSTLQRWEKEARHEASDSTSSEAVVVKVMKIVLVNLITILNIVLMECYLDDGGRGGDDDGDDNRGDDDGDDNGGDDGDDDGGNDDSDGDGGDDDGDDDGGGDDGDGDNNGDDINDNIENNGSLEFMPVLLFRQSSHTAGQAVLQLLQLYSKHAMTKRCLQDLVKLIHNLLPLGNTFPSTYYFLLNNIAPFIPPASSVEHVACEFCGFYLGKFRTTPPGACEVCGELERVKFHEFSLEVLIRYLGLADAIDNNEGGPQSDVSKKYLRLKEEYNGQYDLILMWNADGLKVRESGPASLWELSITICDVPPQVRSKCTLVVGLWYAAKKPKLKTFLTTFLESLSQLEENGVRWTHPRTGEAHTSKVVAPAASVDAPVRAELQNIMQHEGEFSCHNCKIEGEELILGPRSRKRIYPVPDEPCPPRTMESMRLHANRAEAENLIVKGVKGSSILDQWKLFKGSTWRTWLLFVSLPALQPVLRDKYFQHWLLLVKGMSIFLQESISDDELALADRLLSLFVRDTQELYGYAAMTYNLHCLSHLALITKRWGAPWSVSAFKFETLNGVLSRLTHGTIRITTELTNTLNIITATNSIDYLMNEAGHIQRDLRISMLSPAHGLILSEAERNALVQTLNDIDDVRYFGRVLIERFLPLQCIQQREQLTISTYAMRLGEKTFSCYVKKGPRLYALIKKLLVDPNRNFQHTETQLIVQHIIPVQTTDLVTLIPVESICCKVFRVHEYVCKELNRYEHAV